MVASIETSLVYALSLLLMDKHYNLKLIEEHRLAEHETEAVHTSNFVVATTFEVFPDVIKVNM